MLPLVELQPELTLLHAAKQWLDATIVLIMTAIDWLITALT